MQKLYSLLTILCIALLPTLLSAATRTWNGNGNWTDPTKWSGGVVPGPADDAIIASGTANLTGAVTINGLSLPGGGIHGGGTLTVNGVMDWGEQQLSINLVIGATANATINVNGVYHSNRYVNNLTVNGILNLQAGAVSISGGPMQINGTVNWTTGSIYSGMVINTGGTLNINGTASVRQVSQVFTNNGTINWSQGAVTPGLSFINNGIMNVTAANTILEASYYSYSNETFTNNGTINFSPAVVTWDCVLITQQNGQVNINGAGLISFNLSMTQNGTINGNGTGKIRHYAGQYDYTAGSVTSNLASFIVDGYSNVSPKVGSTFTNIALFNLNTGALNPEIAMPSSSNYIIGYCNWPLAANQTFAGSVTFGSYAQISGAFDIIIATPNATLTGGYVYPNITVQSGAVLKCEGFYMGITGAITNNGTVNFTTPGSLSISATFQNNGITNINADSVFIYSGSGGLVDMINATTGTLNFNNTGTASIGVDFKNFGQVNVTGATEAVFGGGFVQSGTITGNANATLVHFSYGNVDYNGGSTTTGFGEFKIESAQFVKIKTGCVFPICTKYTFANCYPTISITLPANAEYIFQGSEVLLNKALAPTQPVRIFYANIGGSGSLNIKDELEWAGGEMLLPCTISPGAVATVRDSNFTNPTIKATFNNNGTVIWTHGTIDVFTALFFNGGLWEINADDDVFMNGLLNITNNGTFSNCSITPVNAVFNIPVINNANGTFKGTGMYQFNSGFTNSGNVNPGCSPGTLSIMSDYNNGTGVLNIELDGQNVGQYDRLMVEGNMTAAGILNVTTAPGFTPTAPIMVAHSNGTMTGSFSQINLPAGLTAYVQGQNLMIAAVACSSLPVVTGTIWNTGCTTSSGEINATATGNAPFTYAWSNGATTSTVSGLTAGTYTVTVSDVNGCPSTKAFTVTSTTAAPKPTSLVATPQCGPNRMKLTWNGPSAGSYDIRYKLSTVTTWTSINNIGNVKTYTINNLQPNLTYNFQIRYRCATGTKVSAYSAISKKTTNCAMGNEPIADRTEDSEIMEEVADITAEGMSVFPNPFSGDLQITVEMEAATEGTIRLMDASGRVVLTQTVILQEGENTLMESGLAQLPSGIYLLNLQTPAGVWVEKLIKE